MPLIVPSAVAVRTASLAVLRNLQRQAVRLLRRLHLHLAQILSRRFVRRRGCERMHALRICPFEAAPRVLEIAFQARNAPRPGSACA